MTPLDYEKVKAMFLNGQSLRNIEKETGFNRKKISLLLREEGIETGKSITNQIFSEILADYQKGVAMKDLETKFKIDRHTINKELKKRGYAPKKNSPRNTSKDNLIRTLYSCQKLSIERIAKQLKVSTNLVWLSLIEQGLNDNSRLNSIYEYNDVFNEVHCEQEAYWLGFLYADGYINSNLASGELTLKESDKKHLERFDKFIRKNGQLYPKTVNGHLNYRCSFFNKQLINRLVQLGCEPRKTFHLQFPSQVVPDELMRHFIRGFFDGDGSIYIYNRKLNLLCFSVVCADYDFIKDFQNYLYCRLPIAKNKIYQSRNLYFIQNGAKKDIYYLFHYLYDDATIYLERKFLKFKNIEK